MSRRNKYLGFLAATVFVVAGTAGLLASELTPDLQKAARASSFEVVMKKPDKDPVSYEKPLPLDLIPFIERNDAYRSIGTAFALGHNRYVTAAHVLIAGVDSQYGPPALRRTDGSVLEIDQIVKFSGYQDFVVFSLKNDPAPAGFETNALPHLDDPVFAVGNALGEGVVIRDGLYTSATPEEQDGRWKWIRFSAAASPGNSGGPLLDAQGRVIGVVLRKSPNENLNYALPITQVVDAPEHLARFDQRGLVTLPFLQGTQTYQYQESFSLPLSWTAFALAYQTMVIHHDEIAQTELLKTYASTLFPLGDGVDSVLYAPDASGFRPRVIAQQQDKTWAAMAPEYSSTDLGGDGSVSVAGSAIGGLLRLVRPDNAFDDAFYMDSKAFMDMSLKSLNMRRPVGTDQVRITSLGPAVSESAYVDHYGRVWQERVYPVPFEDVYLYSWMLPTPDGYSGFLEYAPSSIRPLVATRGRLFTDLIDVSYRGSLAQWRAFFARKSLLPKALQDVSLERAPKWGLRTKRFHFSVPSELVTLNDKSMLFLTMGFFPEGQQTHWDIQEAWWDQDVKKEKEIGLVRRLRPPAAANIDLRNTFENMRSRHSPYDGQYIHESSSMWSLTEVIDVPTAKPGLVAGDVLYSTTYRTDNPPTSNGSTKSSSQVVDGVNILEKGSDEGIVSSRPTSKPTASEFDTVAEPLLKTAEAMEQYTGQDLRGRTIVMDIRDLLAETKLSFEKPGADMSDIATGLQQKIATLTKYWVSVPGVINNRDLWVPFQARNGYRTDHPHSQAVQDAENALAQALRGGVVTDQWIALNKQLAAAYVSERSEGAGDGAYYRRLDDVDYHARVSPCPPPASGNSGSSRPKLTGSSRSPAEFYPVELRRKAVEGMVIVSARVSATGCAESFAIARSSGSDLLDDAALRFSETEEMLPGETDGQAVAATVRFATHFQLQD